MGAELHSFGNDLIRGAAAPAYGACLARFEFCKEGKWFPIFQAAENDELLARGTKSYFIMGPQGGRTRDAQMLVDGKPFFLGDFGNPYAQHGFWRRAAWRTVAHEADRVEMQLRSDEQPFPYPSLLELTTEYSVRGRTLFVRASTKNIGTERSIASSGSHPMIRKEVCGDAAPFLLSFRATRHYRNDPSVPASMPNGETEPVEGNLDYSTPREARTGCDSTYGGWDGVATAYWRSAGVKLIAGVAKGPHDLFHYWNDGSRDVWAFEQLTGLSDAANLEAKGVPNTGAVHLNPGESFEWIHTFEVALTS